ncbi:hypothetical protein D3C72_501420 [compost metagenome]
MVENIEFAGAEANPPLPFIVYAPYFAPGYNSAFIFAFQISHAVFVLTLGSTNPSQGIMVWATLLRMK